MTKLTITKKVKSNGFKQISGAIVEDCAAALYVQAEQIMTDSKQNYVPVVSGVLKGSGTVLKPVVVGNIITVVLGYGGMASEYAVVVHEYPVSYGQHKNKYLQKPLNKAVTGMPNRLAKSIRMRVASRRIVP